MSNQGTTPRPATPANVLASWHKSLTVPQQKKLNTDLLTKARPVYGRDLRQNFRAGLIDPAALETDTIDFVLAYSIMLAAKALDNAVDAAATVLIGAPLPLAA